MAGDERQWREYLADAVAGAERLERATTFEFGQLVTVIADLTRAVAGLVAAEPHISRWKQDEEQPPAGNLPPEAGTDHLWPPRAGTK